MFVWFSKDKISTSFSASLLSLSLARLRFTSLHTTSMLSWKRDGCTTQNEEHYVCSSDPAWSTNKIILCNVGALPGSCFTLQFWGRILKKVAIIRLLQLVCGRQGLKLTFQTSSKFVPREKILANVICVAGHFFFYISPRFMEINSCRFFHDSAVLIFTGSEHKLKLLRLLVWFPLKQDSEDWWSSAAL